MTRTHRERCMPGRLLSALILVAAGTIGFSAPAHADSTGLLDDHVTVSLGTFLLSTDTRVTLNGNAGQQGSEVDLGRDLGFKDSNRFRD